MNPPSKKKVELPISPFEEIEDWEGWLDDNHASAPGIWLKLAKKSVWYSIDNL